MKPEPESFDKMLESFTDPTICTMTDSDIDEVICIGETTPEFRTGTEAPQFYSKTTLRGWISEPSGISLVAKVEDQVVGFILNS